jgi:methionyl-tRNA formyltransferase
MPENCFYRPETFVRLRSALLAALLTSIEFNDQPLPPNTTASELRPFLSRQGAEGIIEVLSNYTAYQSKATPQGPAQPPKAPKLKPKDYLIDFETQTAIQLYNRWRGLGLLRTHLQGRQTAPGYAMFIFRELLSPTSTPGPIELSTTYKDKPSGAIFFEKPTNILWVKCAAAATDVSQQEKWLPVTKLQAESRAAITPVQFAAGERYTKNQALLFQTMN